MDAPSQWVRLCAPLIPAGSRVLDVACGGGRHTAYLLERGHPVTAVDRDVTAIARRLGSPRAGLELLRRDLEGPQGWPLPGRAFGAVVVTAYLHRPILADLMAAVSASGVLIYETFQAGGPRPACGPTNPDFLLTPGELLRLVAPTLQVVGYDERRRHGPAGRVMQRVCARRPPGVRRSAGHSP